ncbi:MAG: V-type ATP synthase subunit D [Thermodesulfobacteriota bacterium]
MEAAASTRHNLMKLKESYEALHAGNGLLKGRRESLMREFFGLVDECIERRNALSKLLARAQRGLELTRAVGGDTLDSFAHASARKVSLEIEVKNVWGVNVPEISSVPVVRRLEARGVSPVGERAGALDAAKAFETVVDGMVNLASPEARLGRVGELIRSDTRKINAIDGVVLPALNTRIRAIERVLEEREREEVVRLKRYKERKGGRSRGDGNAAR